METANMQFPKLAVVEQNDCPEDQTKNINCNNNNISSIKTRTAKNVVTSVIVKAIYSKPGYSILEDYKDRICSNLPDDYNNAAVRLRTLIGASGHMIQWILAGDMSKVNHHIYQVVLVYVCFEPHFIKFCDIMEVLVADDRCIMELRTALIIQLQRDSYITAEEACRLTSSKLFTSPVPTIPVTNADSNILTNNSIVTDSSNSAMQSITTNQYTCILASGSAVEASSCPARSTANINASNTSSKSDGTFTFDYYGQSENISTGENLLPVIAEVPDINDPSKNTSIVSSSVQYTVQPSQCTNSMDVTETDLIDNVLSHSANKSITKSDSSEIKHASISEGEKPLAPTCAHDERHDAKTDAIEQDVLCIANEGIVHPPLTSTQHNTITTDRDLENANTSTKELPSATLGSNPSSNEVKNVTNVLSQTKSITSDQMQMEVMISEEKDEALEPNDIKKFQGASGDPGKTKVTISAEAKLIADRSELGSKEVQEILETEDFAIVKVKYHEIIACLPENYEAMIASLLDRLSDSQICDILSLTAGQAQKILNCLILRLKSKEDLLDFCDSLEKVSEAPSSLKDLVVQLRKETIEMIQRDTDQKHESSTSENPSTAAAPKVPPVRPPHKYLPFHPALLVIPKATNPFDLCQLTDDSKGLAAIKKCYPVLIENLPSNHLTTLVRLQDIAIIPEKIVDSIVPSPSAEIGNKMIINYLIGLIHTEEHIITFCYFAERMLGEFDKCICVLNLKNSILMELTMEVDFNKAPTSKGISLINSSTDSAIESEISLSAKALEACKPATLSGDSTNKLDSEYAGGPTITSLVREVKNPTFYQPQSSENGGMKGSLQCMIIYSHGGVYNNSLRAIPMERPSQDSTNETATSMPLIDQGDINDIKCFVKKDVNKELCFSLCDPPSAQQSKCYYLECIEILFKECSKSGAWIYYSGYGEEGTGNWCFKDGIISFQDIFALYKKHLKQKLLYIFIDCCYSGQWIVDCAKYLDEMGIGACGHQAKEQGILLKLFTSCQPDQKAIFQNFVSQKAIYLNKEDCSIWTYVGKKLSDNQITYGIDFTRATCLQVEGPMAPCKFHDIPAKISWKWEDIIAVEYEKRPSSLLFTVRGTDKGRKAWHLVLVERESLEDFNKKVKTGTVDVAKYGYVVKSGWGKDPPDSIINCIKKCSPSWY